MPSPTEGHTLPKRALHRGAHIAINVTRRTVDYTQPTTGTRLQRFAAGLLLVPVLVIMLALAAIVLVMMLVVAAFLFAALALTAFFIRRRLPHAP